MLYVIYRANHPGLTYRGGQAPIIHLESDLQTVVAWAKSNDVLWAFSLTNAGAYYSEFRSRIEELGELDWEAIEATDFSNSDVKERKQAEFLVHGKFPFRFVERIGVLSSEIRSRAVEDLATSGHKPVVDILEEWYY